MVGFYYIKFPFAGGEGGEGVRVLMETCDRGSSNKKDEDLTRCVLEASETGQKVDL